jgi:CelD/BcsL family acetyltransferase involved in cellulose biosynthesis
MNRDVVVIDPLTDARWADLLDRHPAASVFHSRGWLEALKRTYGYEPIVVTTTQKGALDDGLALCRVRTLMSRRLVSLPFSDHCDPLVDSPDGLAKMLDFLECELNEGRYRSFELRPRHGLLGVARPFRGAGFGLAEAPGAKAGRPAEGPRFCLHTLDLSRSAERIFEGFHHSSTQRAIRRAEREGLSYEVGTSERLLSSFYTLLRLTRRRHGLPPQPRAWFRNLVACLGDKVAIHVASKDDRPIASILTLSFKKTMVYKYGVSDAAHHRLGGMPFLFWQAIQRAKSEGIEELDLGRADLDQPGLIAFKEHLGATQSMLTYCSYPAKRRAAAHSGPLSRVARRVVSHLPDAALDLTGRLLYKHLA